MTTKAVGYIRVSTVKQKDEGVSLKDQREKIKNYCNLKDLELKEIVADEGVSAGIPLREREGGQELLDKVDDGEVDVIVSVKLDRLFRDAIDCLQNTKNWDNQGVALHLLDLGGNTLDTSSPMGRMFLTMSAGFAEMEKNLIQQRTKNALKYKKENKESYSPTPTGYDRKGDNITENKQELKKVKLIKQLRSEGLSYNKIAKLLNQLGLKTKNNKKFYAASVSYIYKNDLYDDVKPSYVDFKERIEELRSNGNNNDKMEILKTIKKLRDKGMSYNKIANRLNEIGVSTLSKGKKWYSATVSYLVKNNKQYQKVVV